MSTLPNHERPGARLVELSSVAGRAIIAAAVLGSSVAYMSDDMLNVALPSVSDDLDVGVTEMQWVVNAYFVTMLACMLPAGSVADIRGRRRTLLDGLTVFTGGAVLAAVAPSVELLVVGRGLQGLGAAFLLAAALALVNGSFAEAERGRALGLYMGITAVATAAGPALGGLIVDVVSWRAIFVAPLVLPLAGAIVARASVPESARDPDRSVDGVATLLAFVTIGAFSLAMIRGPGGWARPEVVGACAAAVIAGWGFVRRQRRVTDPMVPLALFRSRAFSGGNAVTLISFLVSAGVFFFLVVQLQTTLGYRPAVAGVALVPLYVVMLVGSPLAGRLADRVGARLPVVAGNLVLAVGAWQLSTVTAGSAFLGGVLPGVLLVAAGLATLGAPLAAATLGAVGEDEQGIASGVNNLVGQLAGLLMIVMLPAVAGISGQRFDGPEFADGYRTAMWACAALSVVAATIAAATLGRRQPRATRAA